VTPLGQHPNLVPAHPPIIGLYIGTGTGTGTGLGPGVLFTITM